MVTVAPVDGAMNRSLTSSAPSSSGRAERPAAASSSSSSAEQPATSLRSAEQLATPSHLNILSIRDVQRWLAEEPIASCSSADVQRILGYLLCPSRLTTTTGLVHLVQISRLTTSGLLPWVTWKQDGATTHDSPKPRPGTSYAPTAERILCRY